MLLYFILGAIFVSVVLPIIENLLSCLSSWSEYISYVFALKVYKIKQQINNGEDSKQVEEEKTPMGFQTQAVGYYIPGQNQEQEEEEE